MKMNILVFIGGLIVGIVLTGILVWKMMPGMMLSVHKSKLNFEETVSSINESAIDRGWKVPKVYDLQKSLQEAGYEDMTKVKIISICQQDHAYRILKNDNNKKVTAIMSCRIGVYQSKDGYVYISEMNIGIMSKMFGGIIEEVMSEAAKEEKGIIMEIIST